jgi:hypothetical protein
MLLAFKVATSLQGVLDFAGDSGSQRFRIIERYVCKMEVACTLQTVKVPPRNSKVVLNINNVHVYVRAHVYVT